MQGRLIGGLVALGAATAFILPSLGGAAEVRRGGNHGCNPAKGTAFSDNWWDAGDKISWGIAFEPGSALPGSPDQDVLKAENTSTEGEGPSSVACGADTGGWLSVSSSLGPGDDSVRFDAKGLETEEGQESYKPLGKLIDVTVSGGPGADTIRGHKGFDNIRAGSGADVIKADDGRADNVNCGPGKDRADVDNKDDIAGCEKTT